MKNITISKNMQPALRWFDGTAAAFGAALVVFTLPTTVMAQQGAAGAMLEEIVTVARKRSEAEAVQDVPVAVTAFGAEQLDALFVTKLDDLSHMMPNVQLEAVGTFPGVQNFSIRGQGINSSIPSVDPTVGVFVDGIYLGTTFGVVLDTFDLESIEVLRGPQGLLFGRNVTGGAVLLRTRRPSEEFGFRVRVGGNDNSDYNVAAALEGSLVDGTLAGKIVGYYADDSGYFSNTNQAQPIPAPWPGATYFNPATGRDVGEMETWFVRPILTWTPSDRQEWTFIFESGKAEGDGAVWASVTEQRAGVLDEFVTTGDETGFTDITWTQGTLELNIHDVGPGTLTNLLGPPAIRKAINSATSCAGQAISLTTGRQHSAFTISNRTSPITRGVMFGRASCHRLPPKSRSLSAARWMPRTWASSGTTTSTSVRASRHRLVFAIPTSRKRHRFSRPAVSMS
jgi:iron complex outermembrane receptor protein